MGIQRRFRIRAFVSVLTGFTFLAVLISGIALYMSPQGRIANRSNWTFWGLSKFQWSDLHICFSVVLLLAAFLHLWFNGKTLLSYFIGKIRSIAGFRLEWIAALLLCGLVGWGSIKPFAPFSHVLDFNDELHFRRPADSGASANIDGAADSPVETGTGQRDRTGRRGGGFGRQTLAQVCRELDLTPDKAVLRLKAVGIEASPEHTIRGIADAHDVHPSQIRHHLQTQQE